MLNDRLPPESPNHQASGTALAKSPGNQERPSLRSRGVSRLCSAPRKFSAFASGPIAELDLFKQPSPMRLRRSGFACYVAALLGLAGCGYPRPADEVVVPLHANGAEVHIQVWGNTTGDGRYEVVVTTKSGSAQHELWKNWGPARRASLYLSLDDRLVVLGGGGSAEMFDLTRDTPPRWIPYEHRPKESGDDWRYVGAVDADADKLIFYPPSVQPECIPLYGAGSSPYRRSHQDERSCAGTN